MRSIEHDGMGKFEETFADCHGNLYVIDTRCIHVSIIKVSFSVHLAVTAK